MPSWKMLLPWMQTADLNVGMGSDSWAEGLQDQCPVLVPALGNETPRISSVLAHVKAQRSVPHTVFQITVTNTAPPIPLLLG